MHVVFSFFFLFIYNVEVNIELYRNIVVRTRSIVSWNKFHLKYFSIS